MTDYGTEARIRTILMVVIAILQALSAALVSVNNEKIDSVTPVMEGRVCAD